jgi:copper chaperone CopZ
MKTSTFKLQKVECQSCVLVIEGICEDTPGVKRAEVNARDRTLTVEHDPSVAPEKLKQALDDKGYPVEVA